jgi:hypothetical protein
MQLLRKPEAPAAPPPVMLDNRGVDPALENEQKKKMADAAQAERKARGRASTILMGGMGDTSTAPVARRTLMES